MVGDLRQLLTANLALAQLMNVDTHQAALGSVSQGSVLVEEHGHSLPFEDFRRVRIGLGIRHRKVQIVSVDQLLGTSVDRLDLIRLGLGSGQALSLAIAGAAKSLERFRPWLLIELALKDPRSKLDLIMAVSNAAEVALLKSMAASSYNCVRCEIPIGPGAAGMPSASQAWSGCSSDPRAQLHQSMLLCGHQARTSGPGSDEASWRQAKQTCEAFAVETSAWADSLRGTN